MSTEKRPPRVLLVDDSDDTRELYREILSDRYDIVEAEDGRQALAEARERTPDVIVMDLSLPDMRGEDAIAELRRPDVPRIPVVVLSGHPEPRENRAGWDAYLVKPCLPNALADCLDRLLDARASAT
ncbi:MAG TPA: response regulator [Polyangiaceae bacterium]|nr:response regulator [Polyangiaceae bacterium]